MYLRKVGVKSKFYQGFLLVTEHPSLADSLQHSCSLTSFSFGPITFCHSPKEASPDVAPHSYTRTAVKMLLIAFPFPLHCSDSASLPILARLGSSSLLMALAQLLCLSWASLVHFSVLERQESAAGTIVT